MKRIWWISDGFGFVISWIWMDWPSRLGITVDGKPSSWQETYHDAPAPCNYDIRRVEVLQSIQMLTHTPVQNRPPRTSLCEFVLALSEIEYPQFQGITRMCFLNNASCGFVPFSNSSPTCDDCAHFFYLNVYELVPKQDYIHIYTCNHDLYITYIILNSYCMILNFSKNTSYYNIL